jgi:hypothetical protein
VRRVSRRSAASGTVPYTSVADKQARETLASTPGESFAKRRETSSPQNIEVKRHDRAIGRAMITSRASEADGNRGQCADAVAKSAARPRK